MSDGATASEPGLPPVFASGLDGQLTWERAIVRQSVEPFRVLLVGLGNRGKMWASIVEQRADVALSAVVDIDAGALQAFRSGNPDVPVFRDLAEALQAVSSDAVLLVTPPTGRLQEATLIFAAGLPLLAEKPLW